ncbi:MAG: hypothetical protein LBK53_00155 [Heliobacteriaceae bacterium]|nr:hypothetical protein [Heliobacteriaceae bacterium]
MDYYLDKKFENLFRLRDRLITLVTVVTGGWISLFFIPNIDSRIFWFFLIVGLHFDILFLKNMLGMDREINELLRGLENGIR